MIVKKKWGPLYSKYIIKLNQTKTKLIIHKNKPKTV